MKFLVLFLILNSFFLSAADIIGKVIQVYDGDTIKIEDFDGGKYKIRFADIDAPETSQTCGLDAKRFLSEMLLGKAVCIHFTQIDMYGRIVGTVYIENKVSVNEIMVRNGYAWWYREYSKNKIIEQLEFEAQEYKRGIWKYENPVPPWDYRRLNKK